MIDPEQLRRLAIDAARRGMENGQSPFGCAISLDGEVIAVSHNTMKADTDITAHAEMNALRAACKAVGKVKLAGAIVAATCEPCPMCAAALQWAGVSKIYFGATVTDADNAGFTQLRDSSGELIENEAIQRISQGGTLADECRELFRKK